MFLLSGRAEARTDRKREFRNLKRKRSKLIKKKENVTFNRWSVNIEITTIDIVLQYCTDVVLFQPPIWKKSYDTQITISKHLALMTPKGKVGRGMT